MFLTVIKPSILSVRLDGFSQSVHTYVATSQIKKYNIINSQVASFMTILKVLCFSKDSY